MSLRLCRCLLPVLVLFALGGVSRAQSPALTSDKSDYSPGEVAILAGSGFIPGESIHLGIDVYDPADPGSIIVDYDWAEFATDADGGFVQTYVIPPEALGKTLTATAVSESGLSASVTFTDSLATDFSQASNANPAVGNVVWIGSILQQNNSIYHEGMSTLQRIFVVDIPRSANNTYTLRLSHHATKGGIHAYDFITNWASAQAVANDSVPPLLATLNECGQLGPKVSAGLCSTLNAGGFPITPPAAASYGTVIGDDVASRVTAYDTVYPNGRVATIQANNATITSAQLNLVGYQNNGGDFYALYDVVWTTSPGTGSFDVLIKLAGHLAVGGDGTGVSYGPGKGSSNINGGPYHFKLDNLNGISLGSQDNQIKGADIRVICTATCPDPVTLCADPGSTSLTLSAEDIAALGTPSAAAGCAIQSAIPSVSVGGTLPQGTTNVTWTVTFTDGHTVTCEQLVTVELCTPSGCIVSCPPDVTVGCDDPIDPSVLGQPTVTGIACTVTGYTDSVSTGPCVNGVIRTITRTWTISGPLGTENCIQTITVQDNTAPVIAEVGADAAIECPAEPVFSDPTATDACDPSPTLTHEDVRTAGDCPQEYKVTRTWTATDACGNTSTASQTITVQDNTAPVIVVCPEGADLGCNPTSKPDCESVKAQVVANDACDDEVVLSCDYVDTKDGHTVTRVFTVTATDDCGNTSEPCIVTYRWTERSDICGQKFLDVNGNGSLDEGEPGINGVEIFLYDSAGNVIDSRVTASDGEKDGAFCFTDLPAGTYTLKEAVPPNWFATTPTEANAEPGCPTIVNFGNICLGSGGGRTLGFWSNKNGQARMTDGPGGMADALAMLSALNLRNADGSHFNPATYSIFRTWLLGAKATNMANMLSAQLAALALNASPGVGFVDGGIAVYAPSLLPYRTVINTAVGHDALSILGFITVNDLISAANVELGLHGLTPVGSPYRADQEALKTLIDRLNNDKPIYVQSAPCPVDYSVAPDVLPDMSARSTTD